jgi:hypothetical protein
MTPTPSVQCYGIATVTSTRGETPRVLAIAQAHASAIVEYRNHGSALKSMDDLGKVPGSMPSISVASWVESSSLTIDAADRCAIDSCRLPMEAGAERWMV